MAIRGMSGVESIDDAVRYDLSCKSCGRKFTLNDKGIVNMPNFALGECTTEFHHYPACPPPPPDAPSSNALAPGANHNVDEGWE